MVFGEQIYRSGSAGHRYRSGWLPVTPVAIANHWIYRLRSLEIQFLFLPVTLHSLKGEGTGGLVKPLTIQAALLECQRRLETFD